uniref:Choline transporter-like protein n=1 Tax=Leptobrachium leishanense TaxID=445787 RepID=A0A8C5LQX5_9ANUR
MEIARFQVSYGEPQKYDPNFKGPIHNRSCTDILCCILIVLGIVAYVAVGIVAWTYGDPRKVIYPTDSRGQFCGQAGTPNENKPFLFYFNIMQCASPLVLLEFQCPTTQICVEKCPDRFLTYLSVVATQDNLPYYKQFCRPGFNDFTKSQVEVLRDRDCPAMIIPSKPLTRRCFPAINSKKGVVMVGNSTTVDDGINKKPRNVTDLLEGAKKANVVLEDYTVSWYWIILGLIIAMVISLICRLAEVPGRHSGLGDDCPVDCGNGLWNFSLLYGIRSLTFVYLHLRQTWLAFMIILCIMDVVVILLIAIALIKEASRAVGHVMSSMVFPLFTCLLVCLCIEYWAITAVFLSTSNEAVYKVFNETQCEFAGNTCDPEKFNTTIVTRLCPDARCLFAFYGGETYYHNAFMFLWLANFVIALGQVTLAGAFASYYWAFKKPDDMPAFPIFSSLGRALRYHTGSLAFGSLILAIVQLIRILLEYLDHKLKGADNKFARFLLCCLKCCFWCLEKFIKFLNRNAYIMIAIYGTNFCTSARNAFFLLMRNIIRVAVLDKVTDFLLFLGKLLVVGCVGILAFFFFTHQIRIVVYGMCVDTLFLCFLEDLERNDGSSERPYFMSSNLQKLLNKKNKVQEDK